MPFSCLSYHPCTAMPPKRKSRIGRGFHPKKPRTR
jgi:hypothetical protein